MSGSVELCQIGTARVTLRGLEQGDHADHRAHLLRLTPDDRRARFHAAVSDEAVIRYADAIDHDTALIFGIFVDDVLRGVGELLSVSPGSAAEAALSMEAPFRRMHLGRMLVLALILAARNAGFGAVHLDYAANNLAMRRLMEQVGAVPELSSGVVHAIKTIPMSRQRVVIPLEA